jgi:hypothetical protein
MSTQAMITMAVILTGVWGSFAVLLTIALTRDRGK